MTTLDNRPSPTARLNGYDMPEAHSALSGVGSDVPQDAPEIEPVVDCLSLGDYIGTELGELNVNVRGGVQPILSLRSYTWYSEENFNKADRWCHGLLAAAKADLPIDFFTSAIVDVYHFDRALRGSVNCVTKNPPVRRTVIPQTLPSNSTYSLVVKAFSWTPDVPHEAVDTVADFLQRVTPDKLWIADYMYSPTTHYDPIIYATFGPWEVELAPGPRRCCEMSYS